MPNLPSRYEKRELLGKGGGGEVWSVNDRITGRVLALKILAADAGEAETLALVREATALSGLEGLGVPRVVAFGTIAASGADPARRYFVRDLVEGQSLDKLIETPTGADWITPLAIASEKLTAIHRAGLLHGDIKPANIIVGPDGASTLVDLGLCTPWKEGATPRGLTPKYAAPELFRGKPITVRSEVFSLGATLLEGLDARGTELPSDTLEQLRAIATRATSPQQEARFPSVDEFASALRQASGHLKSRWTEETAWPILGVEKLVDALRAKVAELKPGSALAVSASPGAGTSTLIRRLAWTLGVEGKRIAQIESPASDVSIDDVAKMELDGTRPDYVFVDDADLLRGESARDSLRNAAKEGARVVVVAAPDVGDQLMGTTCERFEVPRLDDAAMQKLLERVMPSVTPKLIPALLSRVDGRPGRLNALLKKLAGRAVVSEDELETILGGAQPSMPAPRSRAEAMARIDQLIDMGRLSDAARAIEELGEPDGKGNSRERARLSIARARMEIGLGEPAKALARLAEVQKDVPDALQRLYSVVSARAALRLGDYARAEADAAAVVSVTGDDAIASEALYVRGMVLAFTGEEAQSLATLDAAKELATRIGSDRTLALAHGAVAIVHQRAGRMKEAKGAYEKSLRAAEAARDAGTVALTRLNLGGLARHEGDFASALTHLEAAVDMGKRAGMSVAVQGALLSLANVDLYLGRLAQARASIAALAQEREHLPPVSRATLLGLEADLAERSGDTRTAVRLYEECAQAWDAQGRLVDGVEARLERLFGQSRDLAVTGDELQRALTALRESSKGSQLGEHEVFSKLVEGVVALRRGDEGEAKASLDEVVERAEKIGRHEWHWMALDARARLHVQLGSPSLAKRDTEAALGILERIASELPRDLREVFWNDPRRRAVRRAGVTTDAVPSQNPVWTRTQSRVSTTFIGPLPAEDRLRLILEITRDLAREHDISPLLNKVTDHAVSLLGAEQGFVVLTDTEGALQTMTARGHRGSDANSQFSRSIAENVVATGEPIVTTRARDDDRFRASTSVHEFRIQSVACVPIRSTLSDRPIGALYVETRVRLGTRFETEWPTLMAFADQAAIAIEYARLLDENRKRAEELEVTNAELNHAKERLAEVLGRRTEQLAATRRDLKEVRGALKGHFGYGGLTGMSASMRKVYALIDRIKDAAVPVLITGESGTGKEVVAKAIHSSGERSKKPFVGVNCGAIPENLLEGELFGHMKGAFTGAERDRKGLFREADGGTILLDEVGEMPLKMQAGLLRVLQEGKVRPVGGTKEETVDARVIAATNRDLKKMVEDGTFREDLFYRLHVVEVKLPALRERTEDLPALIDHFLNIFATRYKRDRKPVDKEALRRLCEWPWPGNVRELENSLLNAWLMSDGDDLMVEDFDFLTVSAPVVAPPSFAPSAGQSTPPSRRAARTKDEWKSTEREEILAALTQSNWNRAQAAKRLGVPRRTFYRRLKEFGIL